MMHNRNTPQGSLLRRPRLLLAGSLALSAMGHGQAQASDDAKKEAPKDAHGDAPGKDAPAKDAHGDAPAKDAHGDAPAKAKPGAEPTPAPTRLPRRIAFPPLLLQAKPGADFKRVDFSGMRYTIVLLCASWDPASGPIAAAAVELAPKLAKRKIGFVLALSHDTWEGVLPWFAKLGPGMPAGIASVDLPKHFKNPKVPALWVVARDASTLETDPSPSPESLRKLAARLESWTEF